MNTRENGDDPLSQVVLMLVAPVLWLMLSTYKWVINKDRLKGFWLRQTENIRVHMWQRYSAMANTSWWWPLNFRSDEFVHTFRNHLVASLLEVNLYQGNPDKKTSSEISYQLRDIYCVCKCCWNDATCKWKFAMGKLKSYLLSQCFVLNRSSLSIYWHMSRYKADPILSME